MYLCYFSTKIRNIFACFQTAFIPIDSFRQSACTRTYPSFRNCNFATWVYFNGTKYGDCTVLLLIYNCLITQHFAIEVPQLSSSLYLLHLFTFKCLFKKLVFIVVFLIVSWSSSFRPAALYTISLLTTCCGPNFCFLVDRIIQRLPFNYFLQEKLLYHSFPGLVHQFSYVVLPNNNNNKAFYFPSPKYYLYYMLYSISLIILH